MHHAKKDRLLINDDGKHIVTIPNKSTLSGSLPLTAHVFSTSFSFDENEELGGCSFLAVKVLFLRRKGVVLVLLKISPSAIITASLFFAYVFVPSSVYS